MKKSSIVAALAAAFIVTATAGASAATLTASGSVQVNRGSGFQPAIGTVEVRGGDRILVGAGGAARIAYSDGCATAVRPNSLAVVATSAPCSGQMNAAGSTVVFTDNTIALLLGGFMGTAGILAGTTGFSRNNHRYVPVSP